MLVPCATSHGPGLLPLLGLPTPKDEHQTRLASGAELPVFGDRNATQIFEQLYDRSIILIPQAHGGCP